MSLGPLRWVSLHDNRGRPRAAFPSSSAHFLPLIAHRDVCPPLRPPLAERSWSRGKGMRIGEGLLACSLVDHSLAASLLCTAARGGAPRPPIDGSVTLSGLEPA